VLRRIVAAAELAPGDQVLEVGPGLGALTGPLLPAVDRLTAIEADRRLAERLREKYKAEPKLQLHHADALQFLADPEADWRDWKLVANLPYSVASPLLVDLAALPNSPRRLVVTLQLEVAQRLCAVPGTKEYSRLTLLVGCRYEPGDMFRISPHCFFPEPKVDSACLTLHRRPEPVMDEALFGPFARVVKTAFAQRRKKLRNNLKTIWPLDQTDPAMASAGLEANIRAEKVTMEQFVALTKFLNEN